MTQHLYSLSWLAATVARIRVARMNGQIKLAAQMALEAEPLAAMVDKSGDEESYWRLVAELQRFIDEAERKPQLQMAMPLDGQLSMF